MSDDSIVIPEGYEVVKPISTSGSVTECVAKHKADETLVRLRVFDFTQTSGPTTRRHYREHLRGDITFMEELEHPGIIRLFDYSDTRNLLWIATQPAEIDKLSDRFSFLAERPFEFRQTLVSKFLAILQRIHNSHVVHRNLCSDSVFLTPEEEIYIGDFSFAGYLTDRPAMRIDATPTLNTSYLPPEVKGAETYSCDVSSDIFSAGLLTFEILSAASLPKNAPHEIDGALRVGLSELVSAENIGMDTADVILRAVNPAPEKRWPSAEDLADALAASLRGSPAPRISTDQTATIAVTEPAAPPPQDDATVPIAAEDETAPWPDQTGEQVLDAAEAIKPLDSTNEIWNNHYEILEKIGEGGQAVVYKAYDHLTNEEIAIKTIWSRHRGDRAAINRLKQGAMIARSLTHRNIIKTYSVEQRTDADSLDKQVFIVMELIDSKTDLGHAIEMRKTSEQKFRLDETLHIINQLLDALSYAHEHTIHRDIKPGNIMLVPRDKNMGVNTSDLTKFDIKLIDFGIAKVLSQKHIDVTGQGFRSAYYGAPELADARVGVDARADVFSVGVILYQMLTGEIPRKGSPPANKINREVPAALAKVIDQSINMDRSKRYKSTSEFTKEIERAVSRFNWVRKAAKIAVVLLACAAVAGAVERLLPEPNYGSIKESLQTLESRDPNRQIAVLADSTLVKYSDIEGYGTYDQLKETALEGLSLVQDAGTDKFDMRTFSPWKDQERVWSKIEPDIEKFKQIAQNQREYSERKDLAVVDHLIKQNLAPSSEIVSKVTDEAKKAEELLTDLPLPSDKLKECADSYDSAAKIYANIAALAGESQTIEAAQQINEKLKNVEVLRNASLVSRSSLEDIQSLKNSRFLDRSNNCFERADKYYHTFELDGATQYFSLLRQICGTMAHVKDQVDFKDSDIGLISSRLMELCYEDIKAFESYPAWTEKLEQVYRKKDIAAKYNQLRSLLLKSPKDLPLDVWDPAMAALQDYRQNNLEAAATALADSVGQYRKHMSGRIGALLSDCEVLKKFPMIASEQVLTYSGSTLRSLRPSLEGPAWPTPQFADDFNHCADNIKKQKDAVRNKLIKDAQELKKEIVDSANKASTQTYFWESENIPKYAATGRQYDNEDIRKSIANWKYVEDIESLSNIVDQMKDVNDLLDGMFERKDKLDQLSAGIDKAIAFCEKFRGISAEEKQKYEKWKSELEQLRARLTAPKDGVVLIDLDDFADEYDRINSSYADINAKLPFHRNRVIELIKKTDSFATSRDNLENLHKTWAVVLPGLNSLNSKTDLAQTRAYLESVKEEVDKWDTERFNQQIRDRCRIIADALLEQSRAVAQFTAAMLDEKSRLIKDADALAKKTSQILADEDIRTLDGLVPTEKRPLLQQFTNLPDELAASVQTLASIAIPGFEPKKDAAVGSATFEIDIWLPKFNTSETSLTEQMSQLKALEDKARIFEKSAQALSQQSSIETAYYLALKNNALSLIDYSDIVDLVKAASTDSAIMEMCDFLEKIADDTVPKVSDFEAAIAIEGKELAGLKSMDIADLSMAKDFNKKRSKLAEDVAKLRRDLSGLEKGNLENGCKKAIAGAVGRIKGLIGTPGQGQVVDKISSSLWAFMEGRKEWPQWQAFLAFYHLVVADGEIRLTLAESLSPVNEKGDKLALSEIARNPNRVFNTDTSAIANFGWPRYITHQKDPTVILAFLPADSSAGMGPFYMAVREINYAQYKRFLTEIGAAPLTDLAGWSYYGDKEKKLLIGQTRGQFPVCRIIWDKAAGGFTLDDKFKDDPAAWVTYYGAKAYAAWLDARLPTTSQHFFATRAGAETSYPWGDNLSEIASYAHVRSATWQKAAREYNSQRDNPTEIAYPPVGAIKDFLREEALDPSKIVHSAAGNLPVWPCFTEGAKPNSWGLYDMIGNVWEWCADSQDEAKSLICGGSCLCPPEHIGSESKHEFESQACDVGFRIIIPAE